MQYSISDFLNIAFGIILTLLAIRIYRNYRKKKEQGIRTSVALKDFMLAALGMGFFQIMIGVPSLFLLFTTIDIDTYLQLYRTGFCIGIIPLMMSTTFLMLLPSDFYFPKLRKPFLALGIIASVTIMITLLITPSIPTRIDGVTRINASDLTGAIIGIFGSIATGIGSLTFVYTAVKEPVRKISKFKSWLLALGFILIAFAGPMHLFVKTSMQYIIIDSLQIIGVIIIGIAVMIVKVREPV